MSCMKFCNRLFRPVIDDAAAGYSDRLAIGRIANAYFPLGDTTNRDRSRGFLSDFQNKLSLSSQA